MEPSPDHAAPSKKLVEPWWNPRPEQPWWKRWNPRGTLPQTTSDHPAALAEPSETLAEFWSSWNLPQTRPPQPSKTSWNLTSSHPGPPCSPGGTLVEPYLKPPRPPRSLKPWWNPGGTLVKPSSNPHSKKLVEPWWNPRGTLPPTTPEHPALAEPGGTGGTLVEPW